MRWRGERQSTNIEDRRGMSRGGIAVGGGLGGIVLIILALLFGADPRQFLEQVPTGEDPGQKSSRPVNPEEEELKQFVATVLASTEDVWHEQFRLLGRQYREPTLQLFTDRAESACGAAGAAVGPFYCPADQRIYIDLSFFRDLSTRFRAPGDFGQAYVIAHEVGHHVKNLLGTMDQVNSARGRNSDRRNNELSVRLELQADFYAGVWAHYAQRKDVVEPGDFEEALGAASAVGDDRLQREGQGYVVPDSFTHGTSAQRVEWFRRGFESGDVRLGNTFAGNF